jgi:hypothetical protein
MDTDDQHVLENEFAENISTQVQPTIDHNQRELQYHHQQEGDWYFIIFYILRHASVTSGCLLEEESQF